MAIAIAGRPHHCSAVRALQDGFMAGEKSAQWSISIERPGTLPGEAYLVRCRLPQAAVDYL